MIAGSLYDGGTNGTAGVQRTGNGDAVEIADADHHDCDDDHPPFGPTLL